MELPLEGHIATVSEYLENLKAFPKDLTRFSRRFSYYLISKCWPKMYRRVTSWQALGFLHKLYQFPVSTAISEYEWASPLEPDIADEALSKLLSKSAVFFTEEGGVATAFPLNQRPSFSKLLSAAHAKATSDGACMPLYTRETAEEFHYFLVGTLIMYTRHLCYFVKEFRAAMKDTAKWKSDGQKIREKIEASDFFRYSESLAAWTRVLLYTLTSTAYASHIKVCTGKGANVDALMPQFTELDQYRTFGNQHITSMIGTPDVPQQPNPDAPQQPNPDAPQQPNPSQDDNLPDDPENDDMETVCTNSAYGYFTLSNSLYSLQRVQASTNSSTGLDHSLPNSLASESRNRTIPGKIPLRSKRSNSSLLTE